MQDSAEIDLGKIDKVRLHVSDLRAGMFVCDLDRPWLETPFPLEGFEVQDDKAINIVMQYCQYVHIDLDRSRVDEVGVLLPPGLFFNKKGTPFQLKDIEQAELIRKETTNLIKTCFDEIRYGINPDLQLAKAASSECLASVLRNPEIMMFLVQLRSKEGHMGQDAFNTCIYSLVLGQLLGFSHSQLENLGISGLLHDMGKVSIPEEILYKEGKLTDEELIIVQSHSQAGRDILLASGFFSIGTVDVAYGHHENLDGSGYPRGLQGDQLSMHCKIVGVVDKYDAITSLMPFRPAHDHIKAVCILNNLVKENKIDGKLAAQLISYLGIYPPGTIVELTSKEVGIVINSDPRHRLRPQILLVRDAHKEPCQRIVDLTEKTFDERGRAYRVASVRNPGDFGISPKEYFNLIMQSL
jgi:HD-GYP domain-containing protein (c-di-GMP phosphodiesterase class II)